MMKSDAGMIRYHNKKLCGGLAAGEGEPMRLLQILRSVILFHMIITILAACANTPQRAGDRYADQAVLWLYTSGSEEDSKDRSSFSLYMKVPGQAAQLIAEHVLPGSHRIYESHVLFMDEDAGLYYASPDQQPYKIMDGIQAYVYGFIDQGRRIFALTEKQELILKTFGASERILADQISHVVPLPDRIIALREDGSVYAYDHTGEGQLLAEGAVSVSAASDPGYAADPAYVYIQRVEDGLITDGEETIFRIPSGLKGKAVLIEGGERLLYVNGYDPELGTGALMLWDRGGEVRQLAEQAGDYFWDENRRRIWYLADDYLHVHDLNTESSKQIVGPVRRYAVSPSSGAAAAVLADGKLVTIASGGEQDSRHDGATAPLEPAVVETEEEVRWVGYYGEQLVYTTSSGQTVLHTAEGREPLARFSHWLYDDRYLIGLHEGRITAWDQEARSTTLLNDAHSYDWIYYGERLLAEVALRIADAAGTWLDEDGMRLVIRGLGSKQGSMQFGDGETGYFTVRYAARDHLLIRLTDRPEDLYLSLRGDEHLVLTAADGTERIYKRAVE